jgi:ABC-2 type transport system permease protein
VSLPANALREARASYAFVERNFNLAKRYWGWEIVFLAYTVAQSLAVMYIGAAMGSPAAMGAAAMSPAATQRLILYLAVGTLIWSYLSAVFDSISETITWERWEGTIEYTMMAPISRITHLLGSSAFSVVYGVLRTAVILGVLSLFFHLDLSRVDMLSALAVIVAGSFSFIGFGILAAILPLLFTERGSQMTTITSATLLLVSGIYYPVAVLPGWMQVLAVASPAYYALQGMRAAILSGSAITAIAGDLLPLLAIGVVTIPLGFLCFLRAERFAKRTGRLKRSG